MEFIGFLVYYLLFLYLIDRWQFFDDLLLKKRTLKLMFTLKVLSSFVLFIIYYFYYGNNRLESDALRYFDDSIILYQHLSSHFYSVVKIFFNIGNHYDLQQITSKMNFWTKAYNHGLINDNRIMIRVNFIFNLITMGSFHINSLFMCFLSFLGLCGIFKTFQNKFKSNRIYLLFACFLIPSVIFWGSSLLKESLLLFCLGILALNYRNKISTSSNKFTLLLLLVAFTILASLKVYVLVAILPCLISFHFLLGMTSPRFWILKLAGIHFLLIIGLLNIPQLFLEYDFISIITAKQRDRKSTRLNSSHQII